MAVLDLALAEATAGTLASPATAFGSIAAIGVLGVMDSLLGEDEEPPDGGDGDVFDDDGVGGGDDEFAFDDGGGGGDGQFDDFDMGGMDDEEGGAPESGVQELEGRVEEMEAELESLSSTVSTVRTENEQIGESVEEVEENVRKLLEIYKMVTKGVNPFVDDGSDAVAAPSGDGSLGLFDDEDEDAADEDLDEDVADADAEEFFDEDLEEDEGEFADEDDLDEDLEAEDDEDLEADEDELADEEDLDEEPEESTGGKSFDDLREKYEGESEWSDDGLEAESEEPAAAETDSAPADAPEKPYLESLPAGYATDLLVTDWIEFLVAESGRTGAARAITYYENVEWIDRTAADQLRDFLAGHPDGDGAEEGGTLSMDHHTTSLQFIARIDGDGLARVPERREQERSEEVLLH